MKKIKKEKKDNIKIEDYLKVHFQSHIDAQLGEDPQAIREKVVNQLSDSIKEE